MDDKTLGNPLNLAVFRRTGFFSRNGGLSYKWRTSGHPKIDPVFPYHVNMSGLCAVFSAHFSTDGRYAKNVQF